LATVADVSVLCIPLAKMELHAYETGLITFKAGWDINAGPLFLNAALAASLQVAPELLGQVEIHGAGGIRDIPLIGDLEAELNGVASNRGIAVCGRVKILFATLAGGVGSRFPNGRPPLGFPELLANLVLFTGCDLSSFRVLPSLLAPPTARAAQAGSKEFDLEPSPGKVTVLSIEGAGDAPHVTLRSPRGKTYDFTGATEPVTTDDSMGTIIDPEDRTVVMLNKPEAGRWTAEAAPGSTAVVRIRQAGVLPAPRVKARVTGHGTTRTLRYKVRRIPGQTVSLEEEANGAMQQVTMVKGGGRGKVRFQVTEAQTPRRKIVAQIIQDGLGRDSLTVARFSAPNPKVRAPKVRLKRRGKDVLVRWSKVALAHRYTVVARTSDGGRTGFDLAAGRRRLVVRGVGTDHGLRVDVAARTLAGTPGPEGHGRVKRVKKRPKRRP
jgi:hypothetical protein